MINKNIVRQLLKGGGSDATEELLDVIRRRQMPFFLRAIVVDVINDPLDLAPEHLEIIRGFLNDSFSVDRIPRNSVIARRARAIGETNYAAELFFPFFQSHLSFPVKPGEHVWVMYENQEMSEESGWWISRVSECRDVEDVNYTHADRRFIEIESNVPPQFNNGLNDPQTFSLDALGGAGAYDVIEETSLAAASCVYEPVPRFTKNPGDLAIQGSNNTLINLGTATTGDIDDEGTAGVARAGVGAIDIVVGRGVAPETAPLVIENTRGLAETDKSRGSERQSEGSAAFGSDAARVLVTMAIDPDTAFGISAAGVTGAVGVGSAVVVRADRVRIDARDDIKITVGAGGGASLVLMGNGDVIVLPGPSGVIRLGGADADRALVCTSTPAQVAGGTVTAEPMISTMGGVTCNNVPGQGTYASRILVKA